MTEKTKCPRCGSIFVSHDPNNDWRLSLFVVGVLLLGISIGVSSQTKARNDWQNQSERLTMENGQFDPF